MAPVANDAPLGVYIHIPFCRHICPYCDFNTYHGLEPLIPRYVDALVRDITSYRHSERSRGISFGLPDAPVSLPAQTVYFGGGTPSLLEPEQIGRIVAACRESFVLDPAVEITLEANPTGVDARWFAAVRATGVNRLSIGAQTFDRKGLRILGRQHEASDVVAAVGAARQAGFENISLDLIFGWPGQTIEQWRMISIRSCHSPAVRRPFSLYSLIDEPGTPMADGRHPGRAERGR